MSKSEKASGRVLLPAAVTPRKYKIDLDVDLDKFTFDGNEAVEVDVKEATTSVTLHSKEIYIKEASIKDVSGEVQKAEQINFNSKLFTVEFVFPKALAVGEAVLSISFQGFLNNQMAGFYRSSYTSIDGEKRIMASTQFEALDARRCFPCWDEPSLKASFELKLTVPGDRTAFSNMPETNVTMLPNNRKIIQFEPTPLMSTYLLAICVGEFDYLQTTTDHGVLVRVYAPPGKAEMGRFAMNVAKSALDFYDNYFQVHYPLPKLDMVAIPEFAMGAMENWGLVTYREVDLLIDTNKATPTQRQRVCSVVTHELAHQWFGNLVTMAWWDDLWLNEGFASWMQTFSANDQFPQWKLWEQFTTDDLAAALRLDALRSSHPIQVPIHHAEEVEQIFDAISYCKGACVIRMLHAVLGPQKFQLGLQLYMKKFAYKNTETYDLWAAWEEAASGEVQVQALMRAWTEQMGYPLITLRVPAWDKDGASGGSGGGDLEVRVAQEWFLSDGTKGTTPEELAKLWTVPILLNGKSTPGNASSSSAPHQSMLKEKEATIVVPLSVVGGGGSTAWVKANFGQHVPIRVHYVGGAFDRLLNAIKTKEVPTEDRAGILMDASALAKSGHMTIVDLLQLLAAYRGDLSSTVWESIAGCIGLISGVLGEKEKEAGAPAGAASVADLNKRFQRFVSSLVRPLVDAVGWDRTEEEKADGADGGAAMTTTKVGGNNPHQLQMLRSHAFSLAATYCKKDEALCAAAKSKLDTLFEELLASGASAAAPSTIPSEVRAAIINLNLSSTLCSPTEADRRSVYERCLEVYRRAEDPAVRKMMLTSVGAVYDTSAKIEVLDWSIGGEVKLQDFFYPMSSVARSGGEEDEDAGGEGGGCGALVWDFFQARLGDIKEMLKSASPSLMDAVIFASCSSFCTDRRYAEVSAFFEAHPFPANQRRIAQALERIQANAMFRSRMLKSEDIYGQAFWDGLRG